jgi:hypothetical protein
MPILSVIKKSEFADQLSCIDAKMTKFMPKLQIYLIKKYYLQKPLQHNYFHDI